MTGNYPMHFASMPPELFSPLINALQFSIKYHDSTVVANGLESITALATFSFEMRKKEGRDVFERHKSSFTQLLTAMVNFMFFEDSLQMDLIRLAANTFLALICAEETSFGVVVQQILAQQQDVKIRDKISHLFNFLMSGLTLSLDTATKGQFQNKFNAFLVQIRSLVHKR
eukprot:TRINITY_DN3290_c0_g1_i2.p1 TRINITY_DN3290_c0_g1~~TRINITY_DN3290_c0_g1_i2.p1  ORF type:complete len:184 (+),score=20.64 TRINITY_DN3290_c0_g1_i2:42-554(+)